MLLLFRQTWTSGRPWTHRTPGILPILWRPCSTVQQTINEERTLDEHRNKIENPWERTTRPFETTETLSPTLRNWTLPASFDDNQVETWKKSMNVSLNVWIECLNFHHKMILALQLLGSRQTNSFVFITFVTCVETLIEIIVIIVNSFVFSYFTFFISFISSSSQFVM